MASLRYYISKTDEDGECIVLVVDPEDEDVINLSEDWEIRAEVELPDGHDYIAWPSNRPMVYDRSI